MSPSLIDTRPQTHGLAHLPLSEDMTAPSAAGSPPVVADDEALTAVYLLATCHQKGFGVPQDLSVANTLMDECCGHEFLPAMFDKSGHLLTGEYGRKKVLLLLSGQADAPARSPDFISFRRMLMPASS